MPAPALADTPAAFANLGGGSQAAASWQAGPAVAASLAGSARDGKAAYASAETSLLATASYTSADVHRALSASFRLKAVKAPAPETELSYVDASGAVREVPLTDASRAFEPVAVSVPDESAVADGDEVVAVKNSLYKITFEGEATGAERKTFAVDSDGRLREAVRAEDGALSLLPGDAFADAYGAPASAELSYEPGTTAFTRDKETGAWKALPSKPVTACALFVPQSAAGSVSASLSFDAAGWEGCSVAADASLSSSRGTSASSAEDAVEIVAPKIEVALDDAGAKAKVSLSGLDPKATYTLAAKSTDELTGETSSVDLSPSGQESSFEPGSETAERTISLDNGVALLSDSPADVTTSFSLEQGGEVVARAGAGSSENQPATLADDDAPALQAASASPTVATTLTDATDGDAEALPSKKTSLSLTASYGGLEAGKAYTLAAKLVDADSGELVSSSLGEVSISKDFTPESPEGTVDGAFSLDTTSLSGKKIRALVRIAADGEAVAQSQGVGQEVAIDDAIDMTASTAESGQGTTYASLGKTGDKAAAAIPAAVSVLAVAGAAAATSLRKRRAGREGKGE